MGIKTGSFVKAGDVIGRVDLVVRQGSMPGIKGVPSGVPSARLVVYREGKSTAERVAVPLADCALIPPIGVVEGKSGFEAVLALHAAHQQYVEDAGLPAVSRLSGVAVKTAYDRGVSAWPGESTGLTAEQWGVGRAAHLMKAALATEAIDTNDLDLLDPTTGAPTRPIGHFPAVVPLGIVEKPSVDPEFDEEAEDAMVEPEPAEPVEDGSDEVVTIDATEVADMLADLEQVATDPDA